MARPVTLFTGQWADLTLEDLARRQAWGYDGIELPCWGDHFNVQQGPEEQGYCKGRHDLLGEVRPEVLGDLQPPGRPARLRYHRRAAPTTGSRRRRRTATPRRSASGRSRR